MSAVGGKRTLNLALIGRSGLQMRGTRSIGLGLLLLANCSGSELGTCVPVNEGWSTPDTGQPVHFVLNTVSVRERDIRWNGVSVTEQILISHLQRTAGLEPRAFIIFDAQTSDCAFAKRVRDLLDQNYPCGTGLCGQGTPRAFESAPYKTTDGPPA